jgi:pyruvate dehydrogenase kinase 2/3/4
LQVASFLRRELPIRLAHRVQDLEGVPLVKNMGSVKQVKDLYIKSLLELSEFDKNIETPEQEERFSRLVESIYERHSGVLVQMARGAYEFRNHVAKDQGNERDTFAKMEETHAFLDRFYLCSKFWYCPKTKYVLLVQFNSPLPFLQGLGFVF